jgi:hypothetical protein
MQVSRSKYLVSIVLRDNSADLTNHGCHTGAKSALRHGQLSTISSCTPRINFLDRLSGTHAKEIHNILIILARYRGHGVGVQ